MPETSNDAGANAVVRRHGSALAHHQAGFDSVQGPTVDTSMGPLTLWHLVIDNDALVLGSRQELPEERRRAAATEGIEVVARRSGGGAVYLSAATSLWLDLWFRTPPGAEPVDLATVFVNVGQAWAHGLAQLGLSAQVHQGPGGSDPAQKNLARRVCFGDVGWGEVTIAGTKVVGLAQRRTRPGTRVQCVAELTGAGARVLDFVDTTPQERELVGRLTAPVSDLTPASIAAPVIEALLSL